MATTTASPQSDVNEILNETEIGAFTARYKNLVIGGVIALLIAVFAYGYYQHMTTQNNNAYASELFTFSDKAITDFNADKMSATDLVNGFKAAYDGKEGFTTAGVFMVQISDALVAKEKNEEAYVLLSLGTSTINNQQMLYFLRTRAAAVAEDLGKNKEALTLLEDQLKSNVIFMADKIYLDAGRLYLRTGNKEKAKVSFQWILDQGKEEEFKKMARLYLEDLNTSGAI
jgi:predicted negative regulator of RcsB-dependent stress response